MSDERERVVTQFSGTQFSIHYTTGLEGRYGSGRGRGAIKAHPTSPRHQAATPLHARTHARTRAHTHTNPKSLVLHVYLRAPHREGVQPQSVFKCCGDIWKGC